MSEENKSLIRTFVSAINAKDWTQLRARLLTDFVRHSTAAGEPGVKSADQLVSFLQAEFVTFPDALE